MEVYQIGYAIPRPSIAPLPGQAVQPGYSPYDMTNTRQLPPNIAQDPAITVDSSGTVMVGGLPAGVMTNPQLVSPPNANTAVSAAATVAVADVDKYGDAAVLLITFTGAGVAPYPVLPRPSGKRVSLLIVNVSVIGNIFYNWGRQADIGGSSVPIAPGGNRNFSTAVPQNELAIASTGAGQVLVEYMNKDNQ